MTQVKLLRADDTSRAILLMLDARSAGAVAEAGKAAAAYKTHRAMSLTLDAEEKLKPLRRMHAALKLKLKSNTLLSLHAALFISRGRPRGAR